MASLGEVSERNAQTCQVKEKKWWQGKEERKEIAGG